jgi:hypothetical protein
MKEKVEVIYVVGMNCGFILQKVVEFKGSFKTYIY